MTMLDMADAAIVAEAADILRTLAVRADERQARRAVDVSRELMRMVRDSDEDIIHVGSLCLDRRYGVTTTSGSFISLTPTEQDVLMTLASRPGVPVSNALLAMSTCTRAKGSPSATMRSHVKNLRKKLAAMNVTDVRIVTIHGRGYMLVVNVQKG